MADVVVDKGDGTTEPCVGPLGPIGIGDVEPSHSGIDDFVQRLGDVAFDLFSVAVVENPHTGWV